MMTNFESLMASVKEELARYNRAYNTTFDAHDVDDKHKRVVEEAATSYVEGIMMAVIYGFGVEAQNEFLDMIDDLDYDFIKSQSLTGIALA